jgi:putative transposase
MEFRHMPIRVLALYAQRIGRVFAAPATLARLIRERGWRRPRQRVYPAKPKTGIRASRPNEVWHIDMSVIRLLDGTRTYLHAIIDNFSRRILAWKLAEKLSPLTTCELLQDAAQYLGADDDPPELYADSGVENVNEDVDALINEGLIHRVLAQVEVAFSNSLIEAWWRSLKSNWLHLNTLDTVAAVRRLTSFYVAEHNTKMPHAAFHGQTPDEVYFGRGDDVADQLAEAKRHARQTRLATNRNLSCDACRTEPAPLSPSESVASGEGEPQ